MTVTAELSDGVPQGATLSPLSFMNEDDNFGEPSEVTSIKSRGGAGSRAYSTSLTAHTPLDR